MICLCGTGGLESTGSNERSNNCDNGPPRTMLSYTCIASINGWSHGYLLIRYCYRGGWGVACLFVTLNAEVLIGHLSLLYRYMFEFKFE